MRTNKGCLKLLNETGTQAVSEMDVNTREGRERAEHQISFRNDKQRKKIKQIFFPPKRQIIAADGQT